MKLPEGNSFVIRPAVIQDLEELTAIDALCFAPGIAYPREEIQYLLSSSSIVTLVAERSSVIIGFGALARRLSRQNARCGELVTIEVLPAFRRESIGAALHQALESRLREWGGSSLHLHVAVDNAAALSFYRGLGYRVVSRIPRYHLRKLDAWEMEKILT
ncbi:MAG: GNAT family N-acetyltransferase [Acidobacteriaceae bacterium]